MTLYNNKQKLHQNHANVFGKHQRQNTHTLARILHMQRTNKSTKKWESSKANTLRKDHISNSKSFKRQVLYSFNDLPEWQKDNEYIHTGYIKETNSYMEIIKSLMYLHNESVNIYTHLLPGIVCLLILLGVLEHTTMPIYITTSYSDYWIINFFFLGVLFCFSMSATFHCFKAHSERISIFGNKLDYLGIVFLIISSMVSIMYYGFYDKFPLFILFTAITLSLGSMCTVVSLKDKFRAPHWRAKRATMFVLFGLSAVLPLAYGLISYGYKNTARKIGLNWVLLEGVFYISGATLYGLRIPEKHSPGNFDYFFNSHQIFHVLVVAGAGAHYVGLIKSYQHVHEYIL